MVLLPEGLKALKKVAKEVGLDLRGAYLNLDGGFDSARNRQCIFNAGMLPNIKFTFRTLFHSTKAILEEPPIEEEEERYTAYFMATTSCFYIQFPLITTSC